ncbi:sulfate transport system ATP-binding protein [Thermoflexales bacterium]|nr:sulfate transport system ATP-binding protein [Thermoflexales bacterium]
MLIGNLDVAISTTHPTLWQARRGLRARWKRSSINNLRYNCAMAFLQVAHLSKAFDGKLTLDDVSLDIDAGEIVCLLGPSGCGKTTLLRIIAGLETADNGTIAFEGQDVQGVPVHQRNFGLMFQDFALFPHKNVWDNVIFGLRMQNLPADHIQQLGREALDLVGLSGFEKRDVHQLSGGERQRVALARSLAPEPKLLMLDEPLGALDRQLREELMIELRRILKAAHLTSIYVTHDQQEAFAVADRVAVMNTGRIEQIATPPQIYAQPATEFVARFLGMPNLIDGTVLSYAANVAVVHTSIGLLPATADRSLQSDQAVTLLIRSEAATIVPDQEPVETSSTTVLHGRLQAVSFRGRYRRVVVRAHEIDLVFEFEAPSPLPPLGQPVKVSLPTAAVRVI